MSRSETAQESGRYLPFDEANSGLQAGDPSWHEQAVTDKNHYGRPILCSVV